MIRARRHRRLQLVHADLPRDLRPVRLGRVPGRAARARAPARTGSPSTSTRCPRGRGRSSCRSRSSGRRSPPARCPSAARIPELRRPRAGDRSAASSAPEGALLAGFFTASTRPRRDRAGRLRRSARRALERLETWILERLVKSDGLGAIFPPIINTMLALRCLGYASTTRGARPDAGAREARDRGRRDAPAPAVLLAGLGHGDRARSRSRRPASPPDDPALAAGALALDREVRGRATGSREPGGAARRLVLRVRQRVLPRHRRHGRGADALSARPLLRTAAEEPAAAGARARAQWLLAMQN